MKPNFSSENICESPVRNVRKLNTDNTASRFGSEITIVVRLQAERDKGNKLFSWSVRDTSNLLLEHSQAFVAHHSISVCRLFCVRFRFMANIYRVDYPVGFYCYWCIIIWDGMCAVCGINKQKKSCVCHTIFTIFLKTVCLPVQHGCCNISSMEYQMLLRSICDKRTAVLCLIHRA